jgi:Tol biopolymer transport system component
MNRTVGKSRSWLMIVGGILVLTLLGVGLVLYQRDCQCLPSAASLCATETPPGRIAFIKEVVSREGGIYTMDPNGNNIARLTSAANCVYGTLSSPAWSPDGQTIAFGCQWPDGERNLCLVESQTSGDPCPVTNLLEVEKVPPVFCTSWPSQPATSVRIDHVSWAPDGRQLVFTCPYPGESRALVCTLTLTDRSITCWPIALVSGGAEVSGGEVSVDWNPTYAQLAVGFLLQYEEADAEKHLVDLDGQNSVFLTEGWRPSWSPDGERLLFFYQGGMYVIDRSGHKRQTLYQAPGFVDYIALGEPDNTPLLALVRGAWSPDQQFIVFSSGDTSSSAGIYKLDLTTKAITRLTIKGDGVFRAPDWSP